MDFELKSLVDSAAGGGVVAIMAKLYLQGAAKKMGDMVVSIGEMVITLGKMEKEMAVVVEKLKRIQKIDDTIGIHDRKIATLEAKMELRINQ